MTKEVDCRGCTAITETYGSGPEIVIVGSAVPMMWAREASVAIAEHGFRVTNFDYGSGAEETMPRTALDQARDVLDVMDAMQVRQATLVGLSRGAMTAYWLASQEPERVSGLVLAFPVAGFSDVLLSESADRPTDAPPSLDEVLESLFSPEFLDKEIDTAKALVTTPPGSVARVDRSAEEPFAEHDPVAGPVLVVEAGQDQVVATSHAARYLVACPQAEHLVIEGAQHGWLMEQPDEFAAVVTSFVSKLGG